MCGWCWWQWSDGLRLWSRLAECAPWLKAAWTSRASLGVGEASGWGWGRLTLSCPLSLSLSVSLGRSSVLPFHKGIGQWAFLLLLFLFLQVFLGALTLRGAFSGYGEGSLPQQGVLLLRQFLLCLLGVGGGLPWQLPRLGKDLEAEPGGPSAGRGGAAMQPEAPESLFLPSSFPSGCPAHTGL